MTTAGEESTRSPTRISPASGARKPATSRRVVVLPQPDGPSRATSSPGRTARSRPATAGLRGREARDQPQGGGLAAAGRAEQGDELARPHREIEAGHRGDVAEA